LELVSRIGDIEYKVQRPTQQLSQSPDRSGKTKRLETSHAQGVRLADNLLIITVGALTGAASPIEVMPRLGAALDGPDEAWMVFEAHAVRVAQNAKAVGAAPLLLGRTWQATDILPTLGLVVVAIRVTQTATRGIGGAVLIVAAIEQRGLIDMFVTPVVGKDGDGTMILEPLVVSREG
jgi:hypothetical protein